MSAPAEPVPTLELPSGPLMQWSQMALLLAHSLGQRREQLERRAWSDSEHAAREHDIAELRATIEPAVRAMTNDEIAQWRQLRADPVGGSTPTVTAEVAHLNDRWAVRAAAWNGADTVSETWVSCRDEHLARGLASEILTRGEPGAVERLGAHVQLAEQVAASRAHDQASASPVDHDALAAQIRGAWPDDAAAAALRCQAWPTLTDKLAAAQHDGHDLNALLGGINTSGIPTARKPAALASWMLDQATADGVKDGRTQEQTSGSRHPDHHEILSWVDQLDPASTIDRVGALGVVGYYGTGIDTRLVTRFPDLIDQAAHWVGEAAAAESLAGDRERSAAIHQARAEGVGASGDEAHRWSDPIAEAAAVASIDESYATWGWREGPDGPSAVDSPERTAEGQASADDPTTPRREDLAGQALAGRDLHEAAAARATAAESHGAADAAVARANVTLTAPGPATTGQVAPQVTPPPRPQPGYPTRAPRRGR